jgi:two-component system, NtrC family, sensor kinase
MTMAISLQELTSQKTHVIHPPCVLGRGERADLAFPDPTISQRHALIVDIEGQPWIQDLESANGVYVNGRRIVGKAPLRVGDSIQLGQTRFLMMFTGEDISEQTIVMHSLDPSMAANLDHQKLKLIFEMSTELAEHQDLATLHQNLVPRFKELFKQDRGCIALFDQDGALKPLFADNELEAVPLSRSIIKRVFQSGESFLLEDALSEAALKEQESVLGLRIRSALCVPLIYRNQIYGLIYLDRSIPGAYHEDDLEFLRTIASILAPLIENVRLLSELKDLNARTTKSLKETQSRLIAVERTAAYVRLAQAMAHEIRNPLMAIGGLVRRMAQPESPTAEGAKLQAVVSSVERIESMLREVDEFVKLPAPDRKLTRIDQVIQEEITSHEPVWQQRGIHPRLWVKAAHLMVPVDSELFRRAISLIIREILPSLSQGSELRITVEDAANEVRLSFGEPVEDSRLGDLDDPGLERRPWSLGLFLNLANKIISDHGGRLLVEVQGHSPLPLEVRMPWTMANR